MVEAALRGDELGPWLPDAAAHVRSDDGTIVAAIIISDRPTPHAGNPGTGGPWINDVFVDPASAGQRLGSSLIVQTVNCLISTHRTHLRLAVTHGNPALGTYERLGVRVEQEIRRE